MRAKGASCKEIAERLHVTLRSVRRYLANGPKAISNTCTLQGARRLRPIVIGVAAARQALNAEMTPPRPRRARAICHPRSRGAGTRTHTTQGSSPLARGRYCTRRAIRAIPAHAGLRPRLYPTPHPLSPHRWGVWPYGPRAPPPGSSDGTGPRGVSPSAISQLIPLDCLLHAYPGWTTAASSGLAIAAGDAFLAIRAASRQSSGQRSGRLMLMMWWAIIEM